jgi:hypothetical protein
VICRDPQPCDRQLSRISAGTNNRSKFNVALGIKAQGFCVLR